MTRQLPNGPMQLLCFSFIGLKNERTRKQGDD